jgi:hypothetical protein
MPYLNLIPRNAWRAILLLKDNTGMEVKSGVYYEFQGDYLRIEPGSAWEQILILAKEALDE